MNPLLSDSKHRVVGTRQILRAATQGKLSEVYIAKDVDAQLRNELEDACSRAGVKVTHVDSMQELGVACKISVGAAAAGILAQ